MVKVISGLVLLLLSSPALAWDSPDGIIPPPMLESSQVIDAASDHFSRGVNFYRAANFDAARIEFQAALDLSGRADLFHNLSMVAESQGQFDLAITLEESFLRRAGDLNEREQDEVRGRLVRLRERKSGRAARSPVEVIPTQTTDNKGIERRAVPSGAIGLLTGGGAALLIGIGCGGAALAGQNRLYSGVYAADYDALNDRGHKLNAAAISFYVLGGVAIGAGAGWAIGHRLRRPRTEPHSSVSSPTS